MFRSKPLAVAQLVMNILALVYCLYVYPYKLFLKKRWKNHSLNMFHLIITTCLLIQQMVMLIEVIIHVQAIFHDSLDWRSNRKLCFTVSYMGVLLYVIAGCHLLFYAGHKYRTMVIPTETSKRWNVDNIQMAYNLLILFAAYFQLAFVLTDFVEMDLSLHRVMGASLFTGFMVFVIGLMEIQLVKKVFNEVHISPRERTAASKTVFLELSPHRSAATRGGPSTIEHYSIMQDLSSNIPRIAKIKLILLISFMMMMGFTALCLYIWSDLQNETALVNYYASMATSVVAWDSNQVVLLLKRLHSSLIHVQEKYKQPATQPLGDSSATPSEFNRPTAFETRGLQSTASTSIRAV